MDSWMVIVVGIMAFVGLVFVLGIRALLKSGALKITASEDCGGAILDANQGVDTVKKSETKAKPKSEKKKAKKNKIKFGTIKTKLLLAVSSVGKNDFVLKTGRIISLIFWSVIGSVMKLFTRWLPKLFRWIKSCCGDFFQRSPDEFDETIKRLAEAKRSGGQHEKIPPAQTIANKPKLKKREEIMPDSGNKVKTESPKQELLHSLEKIPVVDYGDPNVTVIGPYGEKSLNEAVDDGQMHTAFAIHWQNRCHQLFGQEVDNEYLQSLIAKTAKGDTGLKSNQSDWRNISPKKETAEEIPVIKTEVRGANQTHEQTEEELNMHILARLKAIFGIKKDLPDVPEINDAHLKFLLSELKLATAQNNNEAAHLDNDSAATEELALAKLEKLVPRKVVLGRDIAEMKQLIASWNKEGAAGKLQIDLKELMRLSAPSEENSDVSGDKIAAHLDRQLLGFQSTRFRPDDLLRKARKAKEKKEISFPAEAIEHFTNVKAEEIPA